MAVRKKQKIFPSGAMTSEERSYSERAQKASAKARLELRHAQDMRSIGAGSASAVVKAEKKVLSIATRARRLQNAPQTHGTGLSNSRSGQERLNTARRNKTGEFPRPSSPKGRKPKKR